LTCSQDHNSPGDRLLDLFVYAPAGLALTMAEELPALVEKGRNRIEGRVATARMVGQFAVQMGLREAGRRMRRVLEQEPRGAPAGPQSTDTTSPRRSRTADLPVASAPSPTAPVPETRRPELAIPAYDTLSASQVVKRLAGLSTEELEQVAAHERSNRHRATILNRVEQLLSG
jgi:hypothetical protein